MSDFYKELHEAIVCGNNMEIKIDELCKLSFENIICLHIFKTFGGQISYYWTELDSEGEEINYEEDPEQYIGSEHGYCYCQICTAYGLFVGLISYPERELSDDTKNQLSSLIYQYGLESTSFAKKLNEYHGFDIEIGQSPYSTLLNRLGSQTKSARKV